MSKDIYSDKGDYELLRQSLEAMKEHAVSHNVTKIGRLALPLFYSVLFFIFLVVQNFVFLIAMPKLGCGLDGLSWTAVRTLIKNVFLKEKIELIVYSLDSGTSDSSQSPSKRPSEKSDRSRSRYHLSLRLMFIELTCTYKAIIFSIRWVVVHGRS